jgi:hypothetical protein
MHVPSVCPLYASAQFGYFVLYAPFLLYLLVSEWSIFYVVFVRKTAFICDFEFFIIFHASLPMYVKVTLYFVLLRFGVYFLSGLMGYRFAWCCTGRSVECS